MISHVSFGVRDLDRAVAFYDAVAATLGWERLWKTADAAGYGLAGEEDVFAVKARVGAAAPGAGFHCAFNAPSRRAVDAFHHAALAARGKDDGAPGLRPHYGERYYAAFVRDPDDYAIEAVFIG